MSQNAKRDQEEVVVRIPTLATLSREVINLAHKQLAERMYLGALPYICMELYNHDITLVSELILTGKEVKFSFLLDRHTYYTHFRLTKDLKIVILPCPELNR